MTATVDKSRKGRCHYCKRGPVSLTKDHVIPRARGGTNHYANLVPCCTPCNMRKSADLPTFEHLTSCTRCSDAVEHHWRFIISQPHYGKRDVLVALVDPLLSARILPIRVVPYAPGMGWDPYRDDYPGDFEQHATRTFQPALRDLPEPRRSRKRARSPLVVEITPGLPYQ